MMERHVRPVAAEVVCDHPTLEPHLDSCPFFSTYILTLQE